MCVSSDFLSLLRVLCAFVTLIKDYLLTYICSTFVLRTSVVLDSLGCLYLYLRYLCLWYLQHLCVIVIVPELVYSIHFYTVYTYILSIHGVQSLQWPVKFKFKSISTWVPSGMLQSRESVTSWVRFCFCLFCEINNEIFTFMLKWCWHCIYSIFLSLWINNGKFNKTAYRACTENRRV